MHFLRVNVKFYDVIHNVIITLIHFLMLLKSCLLVLEIINLNKSDVERCIEYVHRVVVHVYKNI